MRDKTDGDEPIHVTPDAFGNMMFGLTKREYFAAQILQGYIASGRTNASFQYPMTAEAASVRLADKLIEELNK